MLSVCHQNVVYVHDKITLKICVHERFFVGTFELKSDKKVQHVCITEDALYLIIDEQVFVGNLICIAETHKIVFSKLKTPKDEICQRILYHFPKKLFLLTKTKLYLLQENEQWKDVSKDDSNIVTSFSDTTVLFLLFFEIDTYLGALNLHDKLLYKKISVGAIQHCSLDHRHLVFINENHHCYYIDIETLIKGSALAPQRIFEEFCIAASHCFDDFIVVQTLCNKIFIYNIKDKTITFVKQMQFLEEDDFICHMKGHYNRVIFCTFRKRLFESKLDHFGKFTEFLEIPL